MNLQLTKVLKIIGWGWIWLAGIFILINSIMIGLNEGFWAFMDLFNPFNVLNYIVMIATLAPGIALVVISEKMKSKSR